MEFETATQRNIKVMHLVFEGYSYQEIGEKFGLTRGTVAQGVRGLIDTLKEYTGLEIMSTTDFAYIQENKAAILHALTLPFPKYTIFPEGRAILKKHYGNDFAAKAKEIAANWDQVLSLFNRWKHSRDILSIQTWLALEGYLVGDYISDEMRNFCFSALKEKLPQVQSGNEEFYFKIESVEKGYSDKQLGINFILQQGEHKVQRRFRIEII